MKKNMILLSLLMLFATATTPTIADDHYFNPSSEETVFISESELIEEIEDAQNILKIIEETEKELKKQEEEKLKEELKLKEQQEATKKKEEQKKVLLGTFKTTAYDLSEDSCGKVVGSKGYGVTASGFNLSGLSQADAMTVAADTRIIPMGTKIYLEFDKDDPRSKYNGIYTVRDRGGAIKGRKLDIFMGDFQMKKTSDKVKEFGRSECKVYLIK